jgi:hypothetical protein
MTRKYTEEENGSIWYEENGFRYSFLKDEFNPDYQIYLESLKPKADEAKTK